MQVGRITIEILGPVPLAPLTTSAAVVRPGRGVELLEATLTGPGGDVMRARAWRLRTSEQVLDPPPPPDPPPPGPDQGEPREFFPTGHEIGYHTAMELRFVRGASWSRARPWCGCALACRSWRARRPRRSSA